MVDIVDKSEFKEIQETPKPGGICDIIQAGGKPSIDDIGKGENPCRCAINMAKGTQSRNCGRATTRFYTGEIENRQIEITKNMYSSEIIQALRDHFDIENRYLEIDTYQNGNIKLKVHKNDNGTSQFYIRATRVDPVIVQLGIEKRKDEAEFDDPFVKE